MRALGREPALWLALVTAAIQLSSAFFLDLSTEQQALLNALAVALSGAVTAYMVAQDRMVPALVGAMQALLSVAVGFGADLSPDTQAAVMASVAGVAAMFVRTQVWAPEPPQASGRHVLHE